MEEPVVVDEGGYSGAWAMYAFIQELSDIQEELISEVLEMLFGFDGH